MKKQIHPLFVILALALFIAACSSPVGSDGQAPSSEDQVATIVAGTVQALTPSAPESTPEPTGAGEMLPHSFYFLGTDGATGLTQVFRIERDGVTMHQVTFEPVEVKSYDVSVTDGSVAYISNNQLLWVDANGAGRRLLVDGGAPDPIDPLFSSIVGVAYSPNGRIIAYGLRGINTFDLETGVSSLILPQRPADIALGQPTEVYWPKHYSPDGTKILASAVIPNSDGVSTVIFVPASVSLTRIVGEGGFFCCNKQGWTTDGSAAYFANPSLGMFGSGLWRVDAATGVITTLVPSDAGGGAYNLPDEPYLASDGQLYYFFANVPAPDGFIQRGPLQIVRSAIDGVTGRTVVRSDNFQLLNEALWAPDASFVIVAFAPTMDVNVGGQAEVTYLDGRPSVVLTPFAQQMKWGP
jgi:hypothetical protein